MNWDFFPVDGCILLVSVWGLHLIRVTLLIGDLIEVLKYIPVKEGLCRRSLRLGICIEVPSGWRLNWGFFPFGDCVDVSSGWGLY
jgi:hypothetical protein